MRHFASLAGALCFLAVFSNFATAEVDWQEAVTRLNGERSKIISCAALLKAHGNPAQQQAGAEAYRKAKAEIDSVFDGLAAVLAGERGAPDAGALEPRLQESIRQRIAFCKTVESLVPSTSGEKQIFQDVYADTLKPTMDGIRSLFGRKEATASERRTIKTQLEAAKWPDYSRVAPGR
jgi:hypothetical protein